MSLIKKKFQNEKKLYYFEKIKEKYNYTNEIYRAKNVYGCGNQNNKKYCLNQQRKYEIIIVISIMSINGSKQSKHGNYT